MNRENWQAVEPFAIEREDLGRILEFFVFPSAIHTCTLDYNAYGLYGRCLCVLTTHKTNCQQKNMNILVLFLVLFRPTDVTLTLKEVT